MKIRVALFLNNRLKKYNDFEIQQKRVDATENCNDDDAIPRDVLPKPTQPTDPNATHVEFNSPAHEHIDNYNLTKKSNPDEGSMLFEIEQKIYHELQNNNVFPEEFMTIIQEFLMETKNNENRKQNKDKKARLHLVETTIKKMKFGESQIKYNGEVAITPNSDDGKKVDCLEQKVNELEIEKKELQERLNIQSKRLFMTTSPSEINHKHQNENSNQQTSNQIEDLMHKVSTLRLERDKLQHAFLELNSKHNELISRMNSRQSYKDHHEQQQKQAIEHEALYNKYQKEIQKKAMEIHQLQTCIREFEDKNNDLTSIIQTQQSKYHQLQLDIQSITNEAESLTSENSHLKSEQSKSISLQSFLKSQLHNLECSHRAITLEKEQILSQYRKIMDERTEREYHLKQCSEENGQLTAENTHLKQELELMQHHITEFENNLNAKHYDCNMYEQQVETCKRENDSLKRKCEAMNSENHKLRIDITSSRQNINDLSIYMQKLQRKLAHAEANANTKEEMMNATDGERDALQNLLGQERDRCKSLERLLEQSRTKCMAVGKEVERLAKENVELGTLLNEKNARSNLSVDDFNKNLLHTNEIISEGDSCHDELQKNRKKSKS